MIIPFKCSRVSYFKEGLAYVKSGDKWGYIDSLGNTIVPFIYKNAFELSEGLASVCIGSDSCGYINKQGVIKIGAFNMN